MKRMAKVYKTGVKNVEKKKKTRKRDDFIVNKKFSRYNSNITMKIKKHLSISGIF